MVQNNVEVAVLNPRAAWMDETLTMLECPAARRCGIAYLHERKIERRLTAMT